MARKHFETVPTICNGKTLECAHDFMSKDRIKEQCDCVHKATCIRITELLKDKDLDGAIKQLGYEQF
jgi:hypothetical protein